MTQYSYPWTAVAGDRTRTADTAADIYGSTFPTGVIDGLTPTLDGGNVNVAAGVAMVHGRFYRSTAQEVIAYTANVKSYIVLRMDASARTVTLAKLDGNVSAFPSLTQTDATYEIAIASVDATSGVTLVDTRKDTDLCGTYAKPGYDTGIVSGASAITSGTDINITGSSARRVGETVMFHLLAARTTSAITVPETGDFGYWTVGVVAEAFRPVGANRNCVGTIGGRVALFEIEPAGYINAHAIAGTGNIAIGDIVYVSGTYLA